MARDRHSTMPRATPLDPIDQAHRHPQQVGVGELHPRRDVPVVVEHLDPGRFQAVVQGVGGLGHLGRATGAQGARWTWKGASSAGHTRPCSS